MGRREATLDTQQKDIGQKDTDTLVSEIRDTRRSIDSTLEQLGEAIKPARIFGSSASNHRIMDTVHKSTRELGVVAENTRHQLTHTIKSRPVASSILAAGVVATMVNLDARISRKAPVVPPTEGKVARSYYKSPLIFGAAALGIGALVGMAFPPSREDLSVDQFDAVIRE